MAELEQADKDAMLIVEAVATNQWDKYFAGWSQDVSRRIDERWGPSVPKPVETIPTPEMGQ